MKKIVLLFVFFFFIGVYLYLSSNRNQSVVKIPVFLVSQSFHPVIKAKINENDYVLHIDSGSCKNLSLRKNIINKINEKYWTKNIETYDFRGNRYDQPIYSVPDVKIGPLKFLNNQVAEESLEFEENTNLWPDIKASKTRYYHGRVGWTFFKNYCALFDFSNFTIVISDNVRELEQNSVLNLKDYVSIPYTVENNILVISIETDLGKQKVCLDSGASFCFFKDKIVDPSNRKQLSPKKSCFHSSKLVIGGCDFGDWGFAITDMCDQLNLDGCLGADFFLEHAVCFDFSNEMIYLKKPTGWFGTQWRRGKFYLTLFFQKYFSNLPKVETL